MSSIDSRGNLHTSAGTPDGGRFSQKTNSAPNGGLTSQAPDLSEQLPSQVDDALADLYYEELRLSFEIVSRESRIKMYRGFQENNTYDAERYESLIAKEQEAVASLTAELRDTRGQMAPLEEEYQRRGGWSRAFLVSGGHLHNTMECSTCNRMGQPTRFAWMPQFSGADEAEMIEAAGDRCCTVCFPAAPVAVLNRPSTLLTPDEEAAARARVEREAERARKAEEKAAKAILNPDGTELKHPGRFGRVVSTLVTAERELTDALLFVYLDTVDGPWLNRAMVAEHEEWASQLVAAIAAKKGMTEDEVRAAADVKMQAKFKREYRR